MRDLAAQPRWSFFMGWTNLIHKHMNPEAITAIYHDPRMVTRDQMPGWKSTAP